ncbi:MAG: hypothetical protein HY246_02460 [Proteobacteria bacterium]|nr:hypothetical protein [Pseudomonadota bacterium]
MGARRKVWPADLGARKRIAAWIVAAALSAAVVAAGDAAAQTEPPQNVAGRWTGQCYNCPVRAFSLVLSQSGEQLTGNLQASGRTGLGEKEMPLVSGRVSGRSVTFRVIGADGITLDSRLTVSRDGKTMEGQGQHRAAFGLTFVRADQ